MQRFYLFITSLIIFLWSRATATPSTSLSVVGNMPELRRDNWRSSEQGKKRTRRDRAAPRRQKQHKNRREVSNPLLVKGIHSRRSSSVSKMSKDGTTVGGKSVNSGTKSGILSTLARGKGALKKNIHEYSSNTDDFRNVNLRQLDVSSFPGDSGSYYGDLGNGSDNVDQEHDGQGSNDIILAFLNEVSKVESLLSKLLKSVQDGNEKESEYGGTVSDHIEVIDRINLPFKGYQIDLISDNGVLEFVIKNSEGEEIQAIELKAVLLMLTESIRCLKGQMNRASSVDVAKCFGSDLPKEAAGTLSSLVEAFSDALEDPDSVEKHVE